MCRPLEAAAREVLALGLASEVVVSTENTELAKNARWSLSVLRFDDDYPR